MIRSSHQDNTDWKAYQQHIQSLKSRHLNSKIELQHQWEELQNQRIFTKKCIDDLLESTRVQKQEIEKLTESNHVPMESQTNNPYSIEITRLKDLLQQKEAEILDLHTKNTMYSNQMKSSTLLRRETLNNIQDLKNSIRVSSNLQNAIIRRSVMPKQIDSEDEGNSEEYEPDQQTESRELAKLKSQISLLNEEIGEYEENQAILRQENTKLQQELEKMTQSYKELNKHYSVAYNELQAKNQEIEELQNKIQVVEQQKEEEIDQIKDFYESIQNEFIEEKNRNQILKSEADEMINQLQKNHSTNEDGEDPAELKTQIANLQQQLTHWQLQAEELRQNYQSLDQKNTQIRRRTSQNIEELGKVLKQNCNIQLAIQKRQSVSANQIQDANLNPDSENKSVSEDSVVSDRNPFDDDDDSDTHDKQIQKIQDLIQQLALLNEEVGEYEENHKSQLQQIETLNKKLADAEEKIKQLEVHVNNLTQAKAQMDEYYRLAYDSNQQLQVELGRYGHPDYVHLVAVNEETDQTEEQ